MDPDRLKFLLEMMARRGDDWSNYAVNYEELVHEAMGDGWYDFKHGGEKQVGDKLDKMRDKLFRDHIKQQFEAEDARSLRRPYNPYGKQGGIGDLVSESRYRRNPRSSQHTVSSVRKMLNKTKGLGSLASKGAGKYFSFLGPLAAMLGLGFDQATAADELGSGEDEILRQLKGDTDGLSEKEMMQYYEGLLGRGR